MKRINSKEQITSKTNKNKNKQDTKEYNSKNVRMNSKDILVPFKNPFKIPQQMRLFSEPTKKKREPVTHYKTDDLKTICDIDETFYKVIEGRPLRQFSDIKVYMTNIRDITLFKANAAYLKDEIIQIINAKSDEIQEYKNIVNLYTSIKSSFVNFVKESYRNAKISERLCKETENVVENVTEKVNGYYFAHNKLRNEIDSLEDSLNTLSKYGEFLYNISPIAWKQSHSTIFLRGSGLLRALSFDDTQSISSSNKHDDIISSFKSNIPQLYFKKPAQLFIMFEELSKQCLNYMQKEILICSLKKNVFGRSNYLKEVIECETDDFKYIIHYYEKQIHFYELKESVYKAKFDSVLYNDFHNLYASYETTKLFTCLQYAHTKIIGAQEDPRDSIRMLALNLELQFIEIMSLFDDLDQKVVKMATKELFEEDRKVMKQALFAQRTLKECNILQKSLYSSFEPPRRP